MTTLQAAELISKELESRGLKNNYNVSENDYGCSCYFIFYRDSESIDKMKVRVSDHSVSNTYRMDNEYLVYTDNCNPVKVANAVELYLYPERFEFIPCSIKEGATHRINGEFGKYIRK